MQRTRWASFLLTVVLYVLAFPPLVVLQDATLQVPAILGVGLVGLVFGSALLALAQVSLSRLLLYALVVALIMAEVAWAISYWTTIGLVGGALLWLTFYVVTGILHAHLDGVLDRRVAIEYGVVAALGLAIVFTATPWSG